MSTTTVWAIQGIVKILVATLTTWQTSHSPLATTIVGLTALSSYLSQRPGEPATAATLTPGAALNSTDIAADVTAMLAAEMDKLLPVARPTQPASDALLAASGPAHVQLAGPEVSLPPQATQPAAAATGAVPPPALAAAEPAALPSYPVAYVPSVAQEVTDANA